MIKTLQNSLKIMSLAAIALIISQPVMAAKFKCWTNDEGVKECGSYVPPKYSQKRIETRGKSGRVTEVEERAKTKAELVEAKRLAKIQEAIDAKIAEKKKHDMILLKTFSNVRDINMLRDSKIKVIEGIITVTNGNNKALQKKLEKLKKRAANVERRGKKPPQNILDDIKTIEKRISKNMKSTELRREKQKEIREKFEIDLQRFLTLKGKKRMPAKKNIKKVPATKGIKKTPATKR